MQKPDPSAASSLVGMTVADVDQALILATLRETNGNRTHAANILGFSIRTIRNKLSAYSKAGVLIDSDVHGTNVGDTTR